MMKVCSNFTQHCRHVGENRGERLSSKLQVLRLSVGEWFEINFDPLDVFINKIREQSEGEKGT